MNLMYLGIDGMGSYCFSDEATKKIFVLDRSSFFEKIKGSSRLKEHKSKIKHNIVYNDRLSQEKNFLGGMILLTLNTSRTIDTSNMKIKNSNIIVLEKYFEKLNFKCEE